MVFSPLQESSYATLQYNKAKRVMFASTPGQGVVYNVIATDKVTDHAKFRNVTKDRTKQLSSVFTKFSSKLFKNRHICELLVTCPPLSLQRNNQRVAYVPAITYACDVRSPGGCRNEISPFGGVIGIVLIFAGLFLCLVGHLFFHGGLFVGVCVCVIRAPIRILLLCRKRLYCELEKKNVLKFLCRYASRITIDETTF